MSAPLEPKYRNEVIVKMLILGVLPLLVMMISIAIGVFDLPVRLFQARRQYFTDYLFTPAYPESRTSRLRLSVTKDGETQIQAGAGDTVTWRGKVDEDGVFRYRGELSSYTLFWLPVPHGIPVLYAREVKILAQATIVDLTGFLGTPMESYPMMLKDQHKDFSAKRGAYWIQDVELLGRNNAVAGVASYEVSTGLLLSAVSYSGRGQQLEHEKSNFPLGRFRSILLPCVLLTACGLAGYEIFWPYFFLRRRYILPPTEFAMLGYCALLLDVYFDYFYFYLVDEKVLLVVHLLVMALFFYRLGWWATLPLMEIIAAGLTMISTQSVQPALAYFPSTFAAWFLAFVFQGQLSPGQWPEALRFKVKF